MNFEIPDKINICGLKFCEDDLLNIKVNERKI